MLCVIIDDTFRVIGYIKYNTQHSYIKNWILEWNHIKQN